MRTSHSGKKLALITCGDPSGIGAEIILKSLRAGALTKKSTPLIIGDYKTFLKIAKILKIDISSFNARALKDLIVKKDKVNFLDLGNVPHPGFRLGVMSKLYGKAAMQYLLCAAAVLRNVKNAFLVTGPINKESINKAGFKFHGHTEFLAAATKSKNVTMMLTGGPLRVSLATRHISLRDVPKSLTRDKIASTIANTLYALKSFFKIPHPKIGVCALNPHAGEGGLLGAEERNVISPAVRSFKNKNIIGPLPADTLFHKAYHGEFDAVVSMYHDQGLIPLKMTAFEKGVNLTIGLPFIRTSPDHGTGFDIAGKGKADPSSMIEAMKLAEALA